MDDERKVLMSFGIFAAFAAIMIAGALVMNRWLVDGAVMFASIVIRRFDYAGPSVLFVDSTLFRRQRS